MSIYFVWNWFLDNFNQFFRWKRSIFMEKYLNSQLMEDREIVEQPIHLPSLMQKLTEKSLNFLDEMKNSSKPFALYHSFTAVHTPLRPGKKFKGQSTHGAYGDR